MQQIRGLPHAAQPHLCGQKEQLRVLLVDHHVCSWAGPSPGHAQACMPARRLRRGSTAGSWRAGGLFCCAGPPSEVLSESQCWRVVDQAVGRAKEGLDGTKGTCRDWSASEATQHARRTALKSLNASGRGRESCTHLASQTWTGRQGGRTAPDFSLTVSTGFGWCVSRYVHCLLDCMCELMDRCSWLLRKLSAEKPASTF